MATTTFSARDFNQDVGRAKKATVHGPVIITDRGKPAHVLMSIDEYRRLRGGKKTSLLEALRPSHPSLMDDDFVFPKLGEITHPVELD
ncbi:type II toxin-antitoxin system Phd/YefM family antitoxin [Sphingobium yanoikuyae]|uniref:Antitoxin n=1 Tax=Sphingobium yanoikuyae TaxID=13690 RepID=A0A291MZR1_SPHYA|nr:type II toxin-antitoxin system Phd/YefM family antitoxin [Sphingobium yanoikuyae]ATI80587.1 prevent-host-death protein [Sphingobium yanoikuyae]